MTPLYATWQRHALAPHYGSLGVLLIDHPRGCGQTREVSPQSSSRSSLLRRCRSGGISVPQFRYSVLEHDDAQYRSTVFGVSLFKHIKPSALGSVPLLPFFGLTGCDSATRYSLHAATGCAPSAVWATVVRKRIGSVASAWVSIPFTT